MTDVRVPRELFSTLIWAAEKSGLCSSRELASGQALLAAGQPAGDEVQVVGYLLEKGNGMLSRMSAGSNDQPLMTVRQHEAILAAALAAK